jgi:hypothetical protein
MVTCQVQWPIPRMIRQYRDLKCPDSQLPAILGRRKSTTGNDMDDNRHFYVSVPACGFVEEEEDKEADGQMDSGSGIGNFDSFFRDLLLSKQHTSADRATVIR